MPLNRCFPCFKFRQNEVIDRLDYSNTPLTDAFPEVWQHERTLEELQLTSTRLTTLPPQLFYCQGLRILMVNSNNLETIPNAIGSLRQLQHLDLSRNLIANVPEEIKSCRNLTHLDLSCNSLQRLPDAITCLISLQELLLNETYLEFLPANFGRLVNLRILELRLNNLITLPKSMARLTNLQRIDIGGNEFTELPEVIGELRSLRELWIDFNQIRRVAANIGKLRELQHFEANGNLLDSMPNELSNWRNIEVLSICTNNLEALPFSVGMLKSLVTLKCESNTLTELPDSISSLENLEELVLSHNKLLRLPTTIGMLRKLRFLFADNNKLRGLPDELCSCSNLSVLSVANNQINALPQNIGHLVKLKVLNLVNNYINALPVSMLSLVNLTSLWLSDNQSQPLVPLQYLDASTKTQLTCFMLPQVTFKMNNMQMQQQQQELEQQQEQYEFIYAQPAHISQHAQQQQQLKQPQHVAVSPTRRICFAEETTILSATNTIATAVAAKSRPGAGAVTAASTQSLNYAPLPVNNVHYATNPAAHASLNETQTHGTSSSVRLMRSPTPYPKELRQMAKYVRSTQRSPQRSGDDASNGATNGANIVAGGEISSVREARVVPNGTTHCDTQSNKDVVDNRQPPSTNNNSAIEYTSNTDHYGYAGVVAYTQPLQALEEAVLYGSAAGVVGQQQPAHYIQQLPLANVNYVDAHQYQQHQPLYVEGQRIMTPQPLPTTHLNGHQQQELDELESVYEMEVLQQQQQQQQQQHDRSLILTPRMEPPPYHIARVFTKKTPEDLTLYESMRYRNQNQSAQHQQQQQYYNNKTSSMDYDDCIIKYDTEDAINSNFKTTAINNRHESPTLLGVVGGGIGNDGVRQLDYQNNISEMNGGGEETLNDSLSQLSVGSGNSVSTMQQQQQQQYHANAMQRTSATSTPTLGIGGGNDGSGMSNNKKWIFGVHKNPTVKQVTLKWEQHIGFDIAELFNQVGIFVSAITPNTNAARLLHLNDKLLEIDGYDVTNMNLKDARKVLLNCGAVINIMLSRR